MRRMAAIVLTACMLLALCVPAAAAQDPFTDLGQIENRSEVTLLVALGLHRKEALSQHFRQLEAIWTTYEVYLEEEGHHA